MSWTDLALSSSRLSRKGLLRAAVLAAFVCAPYALGNPEAPAAKERQTFDSFAELRAATLEAISGASSRIWLTSDYLTDGEIVTALYVAQYRKLDVKVLLGRGKANSYMSRLSYLKNQNVPVFLKPDTFKPSHATMMLADDQLLRIDGELDFLSKYKKYNVSTGTADDATKFATAFASAADLKVPAVPHKVPLVGKATSGNNNGKGIIYQPTTPKYSQGDGAYIYEKKREPRPAGVPEKLPKELKFEKQKKPADGG